MGKGKPKRSAPVLGRAIQRKKIQDATQRYRGVDDRHTIDPTLSVEEARRRQMQSVLETDDLAEFLDLAQVRGKDFAADRSGQIKIINVGNQGGFLGGIHAPPKGEALARRLEAMKANEQNLRVPRRPPWSREMSKQQLHANEKESFLNWRRALAELEQDEQLVLTPFEKNLEVWRQLWRVIERSDIVVQIVDARDPLLFRSLDLERYVRESDQGRKANVLLLNKADYLTEAQREDWAHYFREHGIRTLFWSATIAAESTQAQHDDDEQREMDERAREEIEALQRDRNEMMYSRGAGSSSGSAQRFETLAEESESEEDGSDAEGSHAAGATGDGEPDASTTAIDIRSDDELITVYEAPNTTTTTMLTSDAAQRDGERGGTEEPASASPFGTSRVVDREELLALLRDLAAAHRRSAEDKPVVGMVGYPNVGKSSTINALMEAKKVAVGSTPGKTKHFQTIHLGDDMVLCDCPGLVFPSFATSKAEMVCNGVLPIDQLRDHRDPIAVVCRNIPRRILEMTYGIVLPSVPRGEPDRPPFVEELLQTYGMQRGFMTSHGRPDEPRTARYILKDYVSGKLLHVTPPPESICPDAWSEEENMRVFEERVGARRVNQAVAVRVEREQREREQAVMRHQADYGASAGHAGPREGGGREQKKGRDRHERLMRRMIKRGTMPKAIQMQQPKQPQQNAV